LIATSVVMVGASTACPSASSSSRSAAEISGSPPGAASRRASQVTCEPKLPNI
jgi:hypothetical protein